MAFTIEISEPIMKKLRANQEIEQKFNTDYRKAISHLATRICKGMNSQDKEVQFFITDPHGFGDVYEYLIECDPAMLLAEYSVIDAAITRTHCIYFPFNSHADVCIVYLNNFDMNDICERICTYMEHYLAGNKKK